MHIEYMSEMWSYGQRPVYYFMKATAESFFPTRTDLPSREAHQQRTYQVLKQQQSAKRHLSENSHQMSFNIFKEETHLEKKRPGESLQRPIGGKDLFKRMDQQVKERASDNRKNSKKGYVKGSQRNISATLIPRRFHLKSDSQDRDKQRVRESEVPLKAITEAAHQPQFQAIEEGFKSHASYEPVSTMFSSTKGRASKIKTATRSQNILRPATCKGPRQRKHESWADQQRMAYHEKSAMLNEINYTKPLVEVYGQRYFQYLLRNRFADDIRPTPPYIYMIGEKSFCHSKAIEKIKKYRPDIRSKAKMGLKGRKLDVTRS